MQETQGVCVAAYRTNEFPAFFTERSGSQVLPMDSFQHISISVKVAAIPNNIIIDVC